MTSTNDQLLQLWFFFPTVGPSSSRRVWLAARQVVCKACVCVMRAAWKYLAAKGWKDERMKAQLVGVKSQLLFYPKNKGEFWTKHKNTMLKKNAFDIYHCQDRENIKIIQFNLKTQVNASSNPSQGSAFSRLQREIHGPLINITSLRWCSFLQ